MFYLTCNKCHEKCFPADALECSKCKQNSTTGAGMCQNFDPEQSEVAFPRESNAASASRNDLDPNIVPFDSNQLPVLVQNTMGSDQSMNEIIYSNTQSIQEMCKITDRNHDLMQEVNTATNRMISGDIHSVIIREAFLNESQWNNSIFQEPHAEFNELFQNNNNVCSAVPSYDPHFSPLVEDSRGLNTLGTSRNHSHPYGAAMVSSDPSLNRKRSASNYISMNETNRVDKIFKPEILSKRGKDVSDDSQQCMNYDKTLGLNATSQMACHNRAVAYLDGQHIESHYNLSQIARNDEPFHISDVVASNSFCYSGENFAAAGSSGRHRDENTPNVVNEKFHSFNKGEIKPIKYEEIKALICRSCEDEIAQHVSEENVLRYFDSLYYNKEGTNLMIHMSSHVPKTTCSICEKEHAVENSHNSEPEHKCPDPDCTMTFQCRTRFYQHIPEHKKYFLQHCWVCIRPFTEHFAENDSTTYVCCVCGYSAETLNSLKNHNQLHVPRSFCNLCEKEYFVDEKKYHGSEINCFVCHCVFKCKAQLEEHFEGHVKYFSELSRQNENYPVFLCPSHGILQTLSDVSFRIRLYLRAGLRAFKCKNCRRKFKDKKRFSSHSGKCKTLSYKCEICETRFHTIDLLHSHGLVKHRG